MGKIVKYCSSCDEGFAERFGFCPNCAASLQTFEMNPLTDEMKIQEPAAANAFTDPFEKLRTAPPEINDAPAVMDEPVAPAPEWLAASSPEIEAPVVAEPVEAIDDAPVAPTFTAPAAGQTYYQAKEIYADEPYKPYTLPAYSKDNDGYHITVIQDKGGNQRNLLLLGSTFLMATLAVGGVVASLFAKDVGIGAIGDERSLAYLVEAVPMDVEEEKEIKKAEEKAGGGGGGGREEEEETSRGDLADQSEKPVRAPDAKVHRNDDFELKLPTPTTQGTRVFAKDYGKWGDPNSTNLGTSNGTGRGGGQGSGFGTGQGSGNGTGVGSGNGSGSGAGNGNGNGSGTGPGTGAPAPPAPPPAGPSTALKIISKPRALYTDTARQSQVQGTVRLRVTFLASGQVGSISTISGLGGGLTEQAISAAKQLRFEPAKVNGIAKNVTKQVEYNFTLY